MGFIIIPGIDISPADALVGDVKAPKTFFSVAAPIKTGTMPTVALVAGSNAYPQGYHVGDALGLKHVDPNLQAAFIAAGVNIFGIIGTLGYFDRYYPSTISSMIMAAINTAAHQYNVNAGLLTELVYAYLNDPASFILRFTPALKSTDAQNVHGAPDYTQNMNTPIVSGLEILVDGFVEEDAATNQTDKTTQARDGTANDLNLCPGLTPGTGDKIYIGCNFPFWQVWANVGLNGSGNWSNSVYYWNGAWSAVVNESGDADFQSGTGWKRIQHTPQGDWALSIIQGKNLYWMKIETTAYVNQAVAPLGTQVFVAIA
jgi:hypothetical protein